MSSISFPNDTRTTINEIRSVIGRPIEFYRATITECIACSEDPITHTSVNPYCTVCSGVHFIHTYNPTTITGFITWNPSETMQWTSGGTYDQYDCRIQIEHTASNISVLDDTDYVIIDGKRLRVENRVYRGVPALNRVILGCMEK